MFQELSLAYGTEGRAAYFFGRWNLEACEMCGAKRDV